MKTDDALENVAKRSKFSETCIFLIHNYIAQNLRECRKTEINIVYDSKGNVNYMISSSLINVVKT